MIGVIKARLATPLGKIVLIASCCMGIWFSIQHIGYTSDSTTYLQLAEFLLRKRGAGNFLFFRTPGYPLLMILGGVPFFDSFAGLLLIQAIMAILIPVLIYKTLMIISPRSAFLGAIFSMITLLPFAYSKVIMTEHAFIFTLVLSSYLVALYRKTGKPLYMYFTAFSILFLTFIRPSANFMFLIIFAFCFFFHLKNWRHVIASFLIFFCITSAWSFLVGLTANPLISGNILSRINQSLFYHIYTKNTENKNYISAANGSDSEKFHRDFSTFVMQNHSAWADRAPARYFTNFSDNPQEFIQNVYEKPNGYYFQLLPFAITTTAVLSGENLHMGRFLLKVSCEAIQRNPHLLFSFLQKYVFGSAVSFAGQQLFYQSYVIAPFTKDAREINYLPVFNPYEIKREVAPEMHKLFAIIKEFVEDYPQFWEEREPREVFANYKGNPELFMHNSLIMQPNIHTYWFMWNVVDTIRGPTETSKIFMNVAIESFKRTPQGIILFLEHFLVFFFGPASNYNTGVRQTGLPDISTPYWWDPSLSESLKYELKSGMRVVDAFNSIKKFNTFWGYFWLVVKPLLFLFILATFLFSYKKPVFAFISLLLVIVLYQGVVVSIFAEPMSRYLDQVLLLAVIVAIVSVYNAVQGLKNIKRMV